MESNCNCAICTNNLPFKFPQEIIKACVSGNLVVFAGAGVSTEQRNIFIDSLYEDLKFESKIDQKEEIDFPELVSTYCNQSNGRIKFLQKLKFRFDYVQQYPELYARAASFHKEISTIWSISTFITTNWDDYFERECGAIPLVTDQDLAAFVNIPERKVLKIHGSIYNYGSIVASKEDYQRCYKQLSKNIIGSQLKTILASKVVLFVGYSFRDFDFNKIYEFIRKELKEVTPHSYIVTLDETNVRFKNINATVIRTNASFFISKLKEHLINSNFMLEDQLYASVMIFDDIRRRIHHNYLFKKINFKKYPDAVYTAMYQDGMEHAFDNLLYKRKTGLMSNFSYLETHMKSYRDILRRQKVKEKQFHDVAYIDGYIWGLTCFLANDELKKQIPMYYIYGHGPILEKKEFEKMLKSPRKAHKLASKWAQEYILRVYKENMAIHHSPFL